EAARRGGFGWGGRDRARERADRRLCPQPRAQGQPQLRAGRGSHLLLRAFEPARGVRRAPRLHARVRAVALGTSPRCARARWDALKGTRGYSIEAMGTRRIRIRGLGLVAATALLLCACGSSTITRSASAVSNTDDYGA